MTAPTSTQTNSTRTVVYLATQRRRRRRPRRPATFDELHERTRALTGPERLEVFARLPARVQARMWRDVAITADAARTEVIS